MYLNPRHFGSVRRGIDRRRQVACARKCSFQDETLHYGTISSQFQVLSFSGDLLRYLTTET